MIERESMDKITVRTTMEPDKDVEMTTTEAEDLRRQGLLVTEPEKPTPAPATTKNKGN